ncbi:DUF86 domain-containing protein [Accumulibacter sp.]|uniref:HepT-like ribonuclease domain-containing protein n=1 Tax=Accumulibacter sp. TaxID=2053492 RepID=UPI0025D0877A|nr:HepT-like ribonuclease domain-containing protein [Accumulibacter sp.]MCM8595526.1 DUF86 domain-containing protein [Accumulibacter sp.]MCM8626167.1 DUF86 domain-containing protein [Accumulibacter sp.]MDS4049673.1 DUF86 domain-containing protein [Accumulibacter sp.]
MQPKTAKLLDDIRDAAAFIREAVRDRTIDDYHGDRLLRQAIERNFEIIGEAMKRLGRHDPASVARIGDYRQIIAFRNILIYGYDLVDHRLVWSTIEEQVPALLSDVAALLGSDD